MISDEIDSGIDEMHKGGINVNRKGSDSPSGTGEGAEQESVKNETGGDGRQDAVERAVAQRRRFPGESLIGGNRADHPEHKIIVLSPAKHRRSHASWRHEPTIR